MSDRELKISQPRAALRGARVVMIAAAALCGLSLVGCKKKAPEQPAPAPAAAPQASKTKPAVLIGSVRLAEGHELPTYSSEQMERAVLAHAKGGSLPDVCSPPKLVDRTPVTQTADGKLVGVLVAASEFSAHIEPPPAKVINVSIRDCRLQPKIVLARIGDSLHITNESPYPLLPGMGFETYNQTLTQGQSRDIKLETGGVKILACGFSAQCGRSDVIVLGHPVAAITDEKGEFRIENFPADETVRINAWHPLFSETYQEVRVAAGEEKRVELVLTPKPPPKPPAPVVKDPNNPSPD